MSYVESYDVRATMNRIFGFTGWSLIEVTPAVCVFEEKTQTRAGKDAYHVAYRAHLALIIHTPDGDATYAGSAVADSIMPDFKRADAHDMALKSAESGALKRAATNLGDQFGLSLYDDGNLNPVVQVVVGFNTKPQDPPLVAADGEAAEASQEVPPTPEPPAASKPSLTNKEALHD
jgi:recombination DNA repair RAD52 pathway protein